MKFSLDEATTDTTETAAPDLPAVGGILLDAWATAPDWGEFATETKISIVSGGVPGEAFAVMEQAPDARIYLGEHELQRAILALSVALTAMRGFEPETDETAVAA